MQRTESPILVTITKYLPLAFLLALAAWPRLVNLPIQGMHGDGDNTYYFNVAMKWAQGSPELDFTCRPVVFFLHGLGIQLFGLTDYAVKYIVAFLGILSVGLTYVLGHMVSKSRIVGFAAGLTIALSPVAIEFSRVESPHTVGVPFLLISTILLVWWARKLSDGLNQYIGIGLLLSSGILLGLTALTHEELAFLGPASVAFIALVAWRQGALIKGTITWSAVYTIGFFIPIMWVVASFGWEEVSSVTFGFYDQKAAMGAETTNFFQKIVSYPKSLISFPLAPQFYYLYLAAVPYVGYTYWADSRSEEHKLSLPPSLGILFPIFYIILFCIFFSSNPTRVFIPLSPFVAVLIFHAIHDATHRYPFPKLEVVTATLCILLAVSVASSRGVNILIPNTDTTPWKETLTYNTTLYRECRDAVIDGMDYRNRMLVVPYGVYNQNHYWNYYFGSRLVDRIGEYSKLNFERIITLGDIRYVAIAKTMLGRWADYGVPHGKAYGMSEADYTAEKENDLVLKYLDKIGARKVFESHNVEIWEIRDRKPGGDVREKYGLLEN